MVEMGGSESGITVSFVKDILSQVKLYICPLQRDITEDVKYSAPTVININVDHCASQFA